MLEYFLYKKDTEKITNLDCRVLKIKKDVRNLLLDYNNLEKIKLNNQV